MKTGGDKVSAEFFVPDLCATRPVFVMVLLTELMVLVHTLAVSGLPRFDWDRLATASLFVQWVVLVSAALLCQLRRPFSRMSLHSAATASLLLVMAVTALTSMAAIRFYPQSAQGVATGWWLLRNTLIAAVLTGVVLRYFFLQQQLRMREQSELQARLDALRARIRPHFLFNTMNSIASLIASQPAAAEQAVEDLAELFRDSLQEGHRKSTVADEIHRCELYLGIERLRLGDRLSVDWTVEPQALGQHMPGLVLQPLVENAVYHGIAQLPAGGTVAVGIACREGRITATVENPLPGRPARGNGHQIALANIEQRLQAHYDERAQFRAGADGDLYRVSLSYPQGEPG
jgi:two-component system sensor histidine kinase AlgZ